VSPHRFGVGDPSHRFFRQSGSAADALTANNDLASARDDDVDAMTARWPNVGGDATAKSAVPPADARSGVAAAGDANSHGKSGTRITRIIDAQRHLHRRRRAAAIAGHGAVRRSCAQANEQNPHDGNGR
jgi:hypothetical protein